MMKKKMKRSSLTIRCQPSANDPLADVVDWLQNMDSRGRRDKVERMLLALLPYAFEADEKTKEEIEDCYWDVYQRLQDYLFVMRKTLGIKVSIPSSSNLEMSIGADSPEEQIALEEQNKSNKVVCSDFDSAFGV